MLQDTHIMTYFKDIIQAYKTQENGTASIEFIIIAPVMIFLYIGLFELSVAYSVNGSINRASEIATSFPTFEEEIDEVTLGNIMTASTAVIDYSSFNPDNLAIKIYSVEQVGNTPASRRLVGLASYEGSNATSLLPNLTASDFTANLSSISAGNGFIVGQVAYLYEPSITSEFVQTITLLDQKTLNPRENNGNALNFTTVAGQERANLNCNIGINSAVFTCNFASQFPEDQGQSTN